MKQQIINRLKSLGPGKAFMSKDFLDIASRGSVDMTLSALVREGTIRRVRRGLYDKPAESPVLGTVLSPDLDEAARALARRHRWKIVPAGAWAANVLGLSTQVPAKVVYLSDGPNRVISFGRRTLYFKHARPQALAGDPRSAVVVQALRYLGKSNVDDVVIAKLRNILKPAQQRALVRSTRFGVDWIYQIACKVAAAR